MRILATEATLGAIVDDIDLRELDASTWPLIEAAFHQHAVLVFPGQHLDDAAHLGFSRWFGPLERATAVPKPGQRAGKAARPRPACDRVRFRSISAGRHPRQDRICRVGPGNFTPSLSQIRT